MAVLRLDLDFSSLGWGWIAAAMVIGIPLSVLANAAEYAICSKLLLNRIRVGEAMRVSILGTAANVLPVPGAVLVRVQALVQGGSTYRRATAGVTMVAVAWIGASAVVAGLVLSFRQARVAVIFLVGGLVGVLGCWLLLRRLAEDQGLAAGLGLATVAVELGIVFTTALRLHLILLGLGAVVEPGESLVLALSGSLAAAVGVFPGGLGLRELVAAGLAPLVGLPASMGFLASALNHIVGMLAYSPLALGMAARSDMAVKPVARSELAAPDETQSSDGA